MASRELQGAAQRPVTTVQDTTEPAGRPGLPWGLTAEKQPRKGPRGRAEMPSGGRAGEGQAGTGTSEPLA